MLLCGMILDPADAEIGSVDVVCGLPAKRSNGRSPSLGGCCDSCFEDMLLSFSREELELEYPLV